MNVFIFPRINLLLVVLLTAILTSCTIYRDIPITSSPSGTAVYVNDNYIGNTPTSISIGDDDIGTYRILGEKEGYFSVSENVNYSSSTVHFTLEPVKKIATLNSSPPNVNVEINNQEHGLTPMTYEFDFSDRNHSYEIKVSKSGYCDGQMIMNYRSEDLDTGEIIFELEVDPLWVATDWSEATNKWMRISIDSSISFEEAWQKVVDSVTSVYDSRSTPLIREFEACAGEPQYIRTQLIGTVSSKKPFVYKIKLVSTSRLKSQNDELAWKDYDRVFRIDAQLVEELTNRLGVK